MKIKLFCLLTLFPVSFINLAQTIQSPVEFPNCEFTAVAHRGYSEFYPENTLLAIEEAFKRGIKYCEIDVAITSDGVYVLHHDPYSIERTTSGQGTVGENTYEQLPMLDAGGWKATYFEGEPVPKLVDALKLAQKYDTFLYLDMKEFGAPGLADALNESGVDASRMMPAITSMETAEQFRQYCPESPWVWFGADPDNPNDLSWYEQRINAGCLVFELTEDKILFEKEWTEIFIQNVHAAGGKVWAYTLNNETKIKEFADFGLDGIETDRPYVAQLYVCGYNPVSTYPKMETNGNWDFKKMNLERTGIGSRLKNLATDNSTLQQIEFARTNEFGIPPIDGIDTIVAKIPAYNPENGLFAYDNFMMEDSGAVDYTYSVVMDILIESKDSGNYIALIQTNPDNLNDADFFISPDAGMGTLGEYHGKFTFNQWHRLVFVHDGYMLKNIWMANGLVKCKLKRAVGRYLIIWPIMVNMAYCCLPTTTMKQPKYMLMQFS